MVTVPALSFLGYPATRRVGVLLYLQPTSEVPASLGSNLPSAEVRCLAA